MVLERLLTAGCGSDAMTIAGQSARQEIAVGFDIVDNENGAGFGDGRRLLTDGPQAANQFAYHCRAGLVAG
ncbi:hypothetical protein [Bradyrhizobium sp. Leo170]|uniref:hypothetical protein n=1 Tax=Bradyrhizobium sp. Leo170 TaxID=1571199 RepID=UPI001FE1F002|nr:hypothetical protein [Bradyrhizobium sp. Leo170]